MKPVVVEPTTPIRLPKQSAGLNRQGDSDMDSGAEVGEEAVHMQTGFLPVEPVQVSGSTSNSHPATVFTNQTDEETIPLPPLSYFSRNHN